MEDSSLDRSAIARLAWTPERREALRQKRLGPLNPMFGKKLSESTIKKRSASYSGNRNPFFGKTHSPEALEKMRENGKLSKWRAPTLKQYLVTDEEYKAQMAAGNRWCCHGKHFVPDADFERPKGKGGVCRACGPAYSRKRKLHRVYGVTPEWYDEQLEKQGGGCGICGYRFPVKGQTNMAIDHDHETGKARGILCCMCNAAIARIEAVEDWTVKALAYLATHAQAA